MKYLMFILILISLISCEKEKSKIRILYAFVEGDSVNFIGNAQRYTDLRQGAAFGLDYHIFNLESPALYIEAYDSSFVNDNFYYPKVKAKYSFMNSLGKAVNYNSIDGKLKITDEKNGVLYGMFNFKLTNILDESDTLEIDKGYFEITLDESDRVW